MLCRLCSCNDIVGDGIGIMVHCQTYLYILNHAHDQIYLLRIYGRSVYSGATSTCRTNVLAVRYAMVNGQGTSKEYKRRRRVAPLGAARSSAPA